MTLFQPIQLLTEENEMRPEKREVLGRVLVFWLAIVIGLGITALGWVIILLKAGAWA